jgi:predicted RNase H-like nuclease (RuvC/YqgF family)
MEFSFAQALNDAKQVIIQQASRIKADSEKNHVHQEMLTTQATTIGDQERRISVQSAEIERQAAQIEELTARLSDAVTAKDQAEAVINRQGERIQSLQASLADLEKRVGEQSEQIHDLQRETESLLEKLPTKDDIEALASMSALLTKKGSTAGSISKAGPQMRLADAA